MKTIISLLAFCLFSMGLYAQQTLTIYNVTDCDVFMKAGWADFSCNGLNGSTGGFTVPAGGAPVTTVPAPPGARYAGAKGFSSCGPVISPTVNGGSIHQFAVGAPGFCTPCNFGLLPFASSTVPNPCCQPTLNVAWFNCGTIYIY